MPGMSAEQQRNLFQAFSQADTSITRKFGGTGLGLAISKHLTELMGGDIRVSSQPRVGSTFSFTVNLRPGRQPAAVVHAASHRPPVVDDSPLAGLRVLLVDDLPTNCLIAGEILEAFGATVDTAENGVQALRKLLDDQIPCDVVLMDIQMPQMDGYEAARRIRAIAPGLPIIGQTAHAMAEEKARCLEAGMNAHVAKPIDLDILVGTILEHVRPAAAVPTETPLIDRSSLAAHYPGRPDFVARLLGVFAASNADTARRIDEAAAAADWASLAELAHALKGSAGNISAPELRQQAAVTEAAARDGAADTGHHATHLAELLRRCLGEIGS